MIRQIVPRYFPDSEVLMFDDGSTDATGRIADRLAAEDSRIQVTHHSSPQNLGGCYRKGVAQATKEFLILVPGDNECGAEVLEPALSKAGSADIIIPYTDNPESRPLARRLLSRGFVELMNGLSGQRLRYYNGAVLHKTQLLRECPFRTDGFGYQAEILVKLLARGCHISKSQHKYATGLTAAQRHSESETSSKPPDSSGDLRGIRYAAIAKVINGC